MHSQRQCQAICPVLLTVSDLKLLHLKHNCTVFCSRFAVFHVHGSQCFVLTAHNVLCSRDFHVASFQSGLANQKPCSVSHHIAPAGP